MLFCNYADSTEDGIRITDTTGKIFYVNNAFCDIVNLGKNELTGKSFDIIFQVSDRKINLERYKQNIAQDKIEGRNEQEHILWNGKLVWLEYLHSVLTTPLNKKIIVTIVRDITDKKLSLLDTIVNENRFRSFFKNAGDAVFINPLTQDIIFENFIDINKQGCELLNYSRDELLNHNIYDLIPIRDAQKIENIALRLMKNESIVFELDLLTKNGRKIPVEINARLFEFNGKSSVISIIRDITERSQAHKQLSKSREQLRSLALRIQNIREEERALIAREIHDELGQLLTVLKIQISLVSKKIAKNQKNLIEKLKSSIRFIDQAVSTVQKITSKLRPGILDELGLIPAIEWQAQEFEQRTGIRCDYSLPKDPINLNREHSTALFRITQEALTNAARHSFAERVSIYLRKENSKLILEITDNGKGIRETQINNPNSLGLLGIKERAMVFGGKVSINGVTNRGTNLKVEWPLNIQ
jgi:PAS domain S-box-containing protein